MNYCDLIYFAQCSIGPLNQNLMRSNVCFELIYVNCSCESGTVYFIGGNHSVESGDIIILPANVKYRFECNGENNCILAGFSGCDGDFNNFPVVLKDNSQYSILWLLNLMCEEFKGRKSNRKRMLNALLNAILVTVIRYSQPIDVKKNIESDNLNYILHFMDAHSQNGINIDEFAKMSGLSYHRFRHKFKELTAVSPQQYIIKQRLNFAKKMLKTTSYSASSIALACGFHSVPQFITCFSKQEGLTPVKYRKMYQTDVK